MIRARTTRGEFWALVADAHVGRLLRVERTAWGRPRVRDEEDIRNTWEEHQRGRPSPRSGKSGNTYASLGHEDETRRRRFAKEIAVWQEREAERLGIERLTVFAPPRFLGALREAWSPGFALRVNERRGELTGLSAAELARHDAVRALLTDARA